jgi:hypothetical protein
MHDTSRAEELAAHLARASLREHWVVSVRGHLFAVPAPISGALTIEALKDFLKHLDTTVESRFDSTGRRI